MPLGYVDAPLEDELVYQHGFEVQGWARATNGKPWKAVVVRLGAETVGQSRLCFTRPDVADAFGPDSLEAGFVVRCTIPQSMRSAERAELQCELLDSDEKIEFIATRNVRFSKIDYSIHGHGYILTDGPTPVLVRDQVYGSGPPSPIADSRCVDLVMRYVRSGESVLDVGCGIGAYFHALLPYQLDWTGCETRGDFVQRMQAEGLRAVHVPDGLPFPDKSFDATICIEVLEHVADYERFLVEIARVSRRIGVFFGSEFCRHSRIVIVLCVAVAYA